MWDVESSSFKNPSKSLKKQINSYIIEVSFDSSKFYVVSINLTDKRKVQMMKFFK